MQSFRSDGAFAETLREYAQKIFYASLIPTIGLLGYLLFGLFSGQLADAAKGTADAHALTVINQISFWLNISLIVTIACSLFFFWEESSLGFILLGLGTLFSFGLKFIVDFLFASDAAKYTTGQASLALLGELKLAGFMIGVPGALLVIRQLYYRVVDSRNQDFANAKYGKDIAKSTTVPKALIGAFAACWQLPFCRENLRPNCPIFLSKLKCWKEQVGCMCEENVMLLAMGAEERSKGSNLANAGGPAPATAGGFVPIGDIITANSEKTRATMTTRLGPNGVRIPTNPHLSSMQKRTRCHSCVIYNEHQREKYQLLSGPVTLLVPVIVIWQFQAMIGLVEASLRGLDALMAHVSFSPAGGTGISVTNAVNGNVPVETMFIVCFSLVMMTWAQKALEFFIFKLKI